MDEAEGTSWRKSEQYLGDCQNYGLLLGPYYNTAPNTGPNLGDPKRDHNFDNPPPEPQQYPRDPSIQIIPTLGATVRECYLHWAIWIPRGSKVIAQHPLK